jgi:microcystin-dependent protein
MAADTYDPVLGLILQGTGNNNNAWGLINNNSMIKLAARATAGIASRAVTGGTLDLSGSPPPATARQDIDAIQYITGTLGSHQTIIVPAISKTWVFYNGTTGAFQLFVKTTSQTTPSQIPQGTWKMLWCEGSQALRMDLDDVGNLNISAKAGAGPGEMLCNGASLLRADFPNLFAKIGGQWGAVDGTHFTLPDFVTGNRFLRAAGGALPVGTIQAGQVESHNHTLSGSPSIGTLGTGNAGDHAHSAGISDPSHGHSHAQPNVCVVDGPIGGGVGGGGVFGHNYGTSSSAAGTGVLVNGGPNGNNATYSAGTHSHTVTGSPAIGTLANAAYGTGSETRPNNAAVLVCIKF